MDGGRPRGRHLTLNGLRLHYLDWGAAGRPAMLLLHGFMSQARIWEDVAHDLTDRYHLLALDQRGHGDSQWAPDAAYGIDDHFTDIALFVEALGLDDFVLLGHSMGGRNALFYAACAPDRIRRLIAVEARPGHSASAVQALEAHVSQLPIEAESLDEIVETVQDLYPNLSAATIRRMAEAGYHKGPGNRLIPKYDVQMGFLARETGFATEALWPYLANVTCPTLLIRGAESDFVSRRDVRQMCAHMPRAQWREIPDASHMPAWENPEAFRRAVLEFLEP